MTDILNTFEDEVIVTNRITMMRLLKLGANPFTLYSFYCTVAKQQKTSQVKATDTYCLTGLGWGKDRLYKAKKLLHEHGFIEQIIRRNTTGLITGHYLKLHYITINHNPENQSLVEPESGKRETNASNNNITAINRKERENTFDRKRALVGSDYRPTESHSKLEPLSRVRLWEIAMAKNVPLSAVKEKHKAILEDIAGPNKYKLKDVNLAVQAWIRFGVEGGRIREMNEIERMDLESDHPDRIDKRQALMKRAVEEGLL